MTISGTSLENGSMITTNQHDLIMSITLQVNSGGKYAVGHKIRINDLDWEIIAVEHLTNGRDELTLESLSPICQECGIYVADYPSKLCTGCNAYKEHTDYLS